MDIKVTLTKVSDDNLSLVLARDGEVVETYDIGDDFERGNVVAMFLDADDNRVVYCARDRESAERLQDSMRR
jgi:hypothetical protein